MAVEDATPLSAADNDDAAATYTPTGSPARVVGTVAATGIFDRAHVLVSATIAGVAGNFVKKLTQDAPVKHVDITCDSMQFKVIGFRGAKNDESVTVTIANGNV